MKVGLQITYFTYPGGPPALAQTFGRIVRDADEAGFYSLWLMDHFWQISGVGPKELDMLEGYTALGYAAALTERIKLGTLVSGVTYRYPGVLVKTATTLDVLSGGRSYFGVGAAWNDEEHYGLGVPFPEVSERFVMLEDTLKIAHQMWSGSNEAFEGEQFTLTETINVPNSLQKPHPPVMIGGTGERKTFKLIAKYGDACNIFSSSGIDFVHAKYSVLKQRCEEHNRNFNEIEKTTLESVIITEDGQRPESTFTTNQRVKLLTPAAALEYMHELAEIGTDQAIFNTPITHVPDAFDIWAEKVLPEAKKIKVAGR